MWQPTSERILNIVFIILTTLSLCVALAICSGCCHTSKTDPKITTCGGKVEFVVPDAAGICNAECKEEMRLTPDQKEAKCEIYGVATGQDKNTLSCECFVRCPK